MYAKMIFQGRQLMNFINALEIMA